jgi:uridine kinase
MKKQSTDDLIEKINNLLESKDQVIVAIDGHSGAGKSSLAYYLSQRFDCNLFHMDDFFLQEEQRTPERYAQPGGNVDYERFFEEVLQRIKCKAPFSYKKFNCQTMRFGEVIEVVYKRLSIVEGSYSHHPNFNNPYDLKVFLCIDSSEQSLRVLSRNGEDMHKRFMQEWVPLENLYFTTFKIEENSDFVI